MVGTDRINRNEFVVYLEGQIDALEGIKNDIFEGDDNPTDIMHIDLGMFLEWLDNKLDING